MTTFSDELARIAKQEVIDWKDFPADSEELFRRIRHYAQKLDIDIPHELNGFHWSALFTSFCVLSAGADKTEFPFSARHGDYVHRSIKNARDNSGVFRGRDPAVYAPKSGDLVCMNRPGGNITFERAGRNPEFASHSVVAIEDTGNGVTAARGNNPLGRHDFVEFLRRPNGTIAPLTEETTLICIIETLK